MGDRQFKGLRQEHRDTVTARKAVGFQDVGKTRDCSATSSNEVRVVAPSSST